MLSVPGKGVIGRVSGVCGRVGRGGFETAIPPGLRNGQRLVDPPGLSVGEVLEPLVDEPLELSL